MTAVFVAGSRKLGRLNQQLRNRIDNLTKQRFLIYVGDANGADKAVQKYLSECGYSEVVIYCSGLQCRNNIGNWTTRNVAVDPGVAGREFYTRKDRRMAEDADFGFFIWDGKSSGTLSNILELLKRNKKSLVYFSPDQEFVPIVETRDVEKLLARCAPTDVTKLSKKLALTKQLSEVATSRQVRLGL